jgi:hypothetical protein
MKFDFLFITQDTRTGKSSHVEIESVEADNIMDAYEKAKTSSESSFPHSPVPSLLGGFTIVKRQIEQVLENDDLLEALFDDLAEGGDLIQFNDSVMPDEVKGYKTYVGETFSVDIKDADVRLSCDFERSGISRDDYISEDVKKRYALDELTEQEIYNLILFMMEKRGWKKVLNIREN